MGDLCPLSKSCDQEIPLPINESFVPDLELPVQGFCAAEVLYPSLEEQTMTKKSTPSTVE